MAGGNFTEISRQSLRPIRVVLPPNGLTAGFTTEVALLHAQVTATLHQSRILASLRDRLLPNLLSGEPTIQTK